MYHSPTNNMKPLKFCFIVFLVCACADQQPSGRLAQPHDKKSTKAPPGGKTETVVQQMDDDYTRERGFVRCSAAYRVPHAKSSYTPEPLRSEHLKRL
ncbi:hypothetical protein T06_291 [Trichinella sp. T6]|nr:hypothetical protein T06_291 [Trichinella sp. T6]